VSCADSGGTQTVADIWYTYTATCTGVLTVTTCSQLGGNSNYDSDIVLYPGNAACPPAPSAIIACNDDDVDGNACGNAPPWSSTMHANVTSGSTYLLRVGGWQNTTDIGTGVLNVSCTVAVCGNGVVEVGEQCDDGNNIPGDGCTNYQIDPNCNPACTVTPVEACVVGTDTVNGGCNTTPALYTPITLVGGTAVVCGELWAAPVGTTNTRDLDWYTVTVGASGRVEAHITTTTLMPVFCGVGTAGGPPGSTPCTALSLNTSDTALQGECKVAIRFGLTPGTTALVIASPTVFTGFPCSSGPWPYKLRILSP
jgi:cysteine-rich repeat protein